MGAGHALCYFKGTSGWHLKLSSDKPQVSRFTDVDWVVILMSGALLGCISSSSGVVWLAGS